MPTLRLAALAALAAIFVLQPAHSQTAPAKPAASSAVEYTDAEVRKVDRANRKVTLKHGDIKNLGMPAMTMMFDVKDAGALDKLKEGDKVRFKAVNEGGKLVVVDLKPRR